MYAEWGRPPSKVEIHRYALSFATSCSRLRMMACCEERQIKHGTQGRVHVYEMHKSMHNRSGLYNGNTTRHSGCQVSGFRTKITRSSGSKFSPHYQNAGFRRLCFLYSVQIRIYDTFDNCSLPQYHLHLPLLQLHEAIKPVYFDESLDRPRYESSGFPKEETGVRLLILTSWAMSNETTRMFPVRAAMEITVST